MAWLEEGSCSSESGQEWPVASAEDQFRLAQNRDAYLRRADGQPSKVEE